MLSAILWALVAGTVLGLLAKLVAPGDRDNIPLWLTILCGIGGGLLGTWLYELFDAPMLAALDHTDRLLLVCNPEVTSLKNVRIGLETIDRLGFERERISLVANRVGAPGALGRSDIEHALDATTAYELPDDSTVPAAVNRALPIVLANERSKFSRALAELASDVFKQPETERQKSKRRFIGGRR